MRVATATSLRVAWKISIKTIMASSLGTRCEDIFVLGAVDTFVAGILSRRSNDGAKGGP